MRKLIGLGMILAGVAWMAYADEMDGWYAFTPSNRHSELSAIGMESWNNEPAGAHGRVLAKGDKLFYNGKEIKLWGLNNCYAACAPDKALADRRAALYSKFGFNSVRLHKFADGDGWAGIRKPGSFLEFDPAALDRMDYFIAKLKESGIFTKLSPSFGVKFGEKDLARVPFHAEIGKLKNNKGSIYAGGCWAHMATELQDLQIEQTISVLNHTNPYTGLRYAEEPAVFCVELHNEGSILFYDSNSKLQRSPTMRERHGKGFSEWLKIKYKNEENWRAAWGEAVIISDPASIGNRHMNHLVTPKGGIQPESLAAGTVVPWGNPWFYDAALNETPEEAVLRQRMLDTMQYLIGLQNDYYSRFVKAIRATGYAGEIIGSNWQAGNDAGHLLNLHSDSLVGPVDRHNYFGGGRGAMWNSKPFKDGSMLAVPGSGALLSTGFQQVEGRPFMFSEWIHVQPNEWYAEGPAILGAYGWGLQGWDIAYIFQNKDEGAFSKKLGLQLWDVTNPAVLASYAAISRQVRRFDVKESPETKKLNVHLPSVKEGRVSFRGLTEQNHDEKSFLTDRVPMEALAATRVAVSFNESFQDTPPFDMGPYRDGDTIVSSTKQLRWTRAAEGESKGGYFTMNTPGTKAFVGFAPGGATFDLGDGYSITPDKGFAVIYLTAKNPDETLAHAREIIMTAMARTRNSGMQFNEEGNIILAKGDAPLRMEPVRAVITLPFDGQLEVLDQDGNGSVESHSFKKTFRIDGTQDRTPFYLIQK